MHLHKFFSVYHRHHNILHVCAVLHSFSVGICQQVGMNLVLRVMYKIFPMSWFVMLGWMLIRVSTIDVQAVTRGKDSSQSDGTEGELIYEE